MFRPRRLRLRYIVSPFLAFAAVYGFLALALEEPATVSAPVAVEAKLTPESRPTFRSVEPYYLGTAHLEESAPGKKRVVIAAVQKPVQKPDIANEKPALQPEVEPLQEKIASVLKGLAPTAPVAEKKINVGKGDTLMDLLVKKADLPRDEAHQVVQALKKVYDPRDLSPRHEITVFFHQNPSIADPKFSGLRIEKDMLNTVVLNLADEGKYTVSEEEKQVRKGMKAYRGTINNSLYVDARAQGVPDAVIFDLIKMYSFSVDFQREIQRGDQFEVMYEEYRTEDGDFVPGRGEIVYAQLVLSGDNMPLYRFEDNGGIVAYYDAEGRSAKKPLMRTPIDGARLSSGFGMRKHPVLGYSKMHKGVDFAAPRGTPIYAAGDGVVEKMGKNGSYGNYVRIRHGGGMKTAYAHMKGFKAGLFTGAKVKQGEVIGYVGSTGRSTGPHLHYEVIVGGKQVNPNSLKSPTSKALAGKDLKSFKTAMAAAQQKFREIGNATTVASNTATR